MAKHEIKYGDTLWAISRKATGRGINYKLIAELNDIEDPNNVPIGTELYIPDKNTNRVSTKDLEEGDGFIEMDEYSPDYDYAVKGNSVYYRMKGTDVWSDISDAPGIKDRFRDYIAEEASQKESAQPAPDVPDSATLGNAATYANTNRTQPASTVEPSDEDSLFDQIMYYGNLAVNGLRRAFLKRFGDDDQASSLEVPDEPEINPLDVSFTGDTVHVNDRRYFLPESLNINNARFGYRNRGDFSEREGIGAITTFNPFRPKSEINSKKGFYIGVSGDGKFKYGDISKFDDTDMISRVYVNRVKSFDTNDDGSLRFKEAGKGNQGRYMPVINVIEGGREVKGSLNFLTGKDHRTDTYGDITGGRVLLITDDGRIRLVSGSIDDVKKEFERVKELSGQDALNVVVLDNGTYSRGLRTYDNRMTEGDLRSYDAQNTSGGNFLFIQDLMETNNIAQRREGGSVSPLVIKTFNPDAFAEAMLSMERVGDGSGRKVDIKNMEKIYYGLISRGVNGNQLKALMGAIAEESGGDPYIESSGKNYRGLSQWSKERLTDEEFKKIKEMSVDDAIDYELDKLIDGLNATSGNDSFTHGGKGSGYDTGAQAMNAFWNQDGTLESVVHALNNGYIRPGDREGTTKNRIRAARLLNNEGVLTDNNAPEEFRPIIEDPFFGYYKADGGPTSDEYREMFRDLYKQDIERIQNGQRAVFFGHLNDEPLENVYPEFDLIFNPAKVISPKENYGNMVGFSAEDAWKVLDKATDIQELIIRVPYNLGRMLNEFVSDMSTKGAKKLINMAPEKYRDTLTKIGRYVKRRPKLTTSFLTSFFYDDITGRNKENGLTEEGQTQESFNDAFRRAKEDGKKRFTWNGKEYTTETRPDGGPVNEGGPVAPRDAIQPPANPTMDFTNLIGESIPYDAGTLPDINVIMDLSPNEAILRRIANNLSSRNMLAENAAYYSGQDEITAEELANYIGKMSPRRFAMSIGSDDDKLNDFSTRLTTGVLNGDEQAIEDAEILRRMMLETPFNNSNVVIMKDGGNILPDPDSLYTPPLLAEYEQGGEVIKNRQMYIYNRLKEEAHMDDYQALAVIGNLMGESGLNPDLYGDQNTAYGIQQWRGERRDRLNKLAREKGEETPSFETQVDYLISEYLAKPGKNGFIYDDKGKMGSGYYNYSRKEFQNASTLRDATVAWNLGSGRPHKNYMRNDERYQFAKQAANNLGIELDEPDENYYSDNGVVQNGFRAPSVNLAQNSTSKRSDNSRSSTVKIEEGNIPDRSESRSSEDMTDFQRSVINELLIQRGLIMGEQVKQQEEADAQRVAEEKQARVNEEARRNAIIQSVLQNAKLDIPGMASR